MIVVTSTAKDAVGYAGRCVESVARERATFFGDLGADIVQHRFVAADEATANDARGHGANVELRDAPAIDNLLYVWRQLPPEAIVVWLDGDDRLAPGALERVSSFYFLSDVWCTYGSFVTENRVLDWTYHQHFGRRYLGRPRIEQWRASHLKTFRAGLVQAVPSAYLEAGGAPVTHAVDCAVMFALLELAGERYAVSTDVNCIYSQSHSAEATDRDATRAVEDATLQWLRSLSPLDPLERPPWHHTNGAT